MLRGRFAQVAEFVSILLLLLGIVALCQPFAFGLFQKGFGILLAGWIGLTLFSHRTAIHPAPHHSESAPPESPFLADLGVPNDMEERQVPDIPRPS
jgi:hypothetical protein